MNKKQVQNLETIKILYEQQKEMYEQRTHKIESRIVGGLKRGLNYIDEGLATMNKYFWKVASNNSI